MSDLLQYLIIGLGNGALYALLGLALVVVYRSTGMVNFAQGEMATLTTFLVWTSVDAGLHPVLALAVGVAAGYVLGVVVFWAVVRPLGDPRARSHDAITVTVGLFVGLSSLAQLIWGTDERTVPRLFGDGTTLLGGATLAAQKVGVLATLLVVSAALWWLFQRTRVGLRIRATVSNPASAALAGVSTRHMLMTGWGLAAAIGAVAGMLTAPDATLTTSMMRLPLVYAIAAVTLGGFDSFGGAIVGGLAIGVVSDVVPRYVPILEKAPLLLVFVAIVVVLVVRPTGLLGRRSSARA